MHTRSSLLSSKITSPARTAALVVGKNFGARKAPSEDLTVDQAPSPDVEFDWHGHPATGSSPAGYNAAPVTLLRAAPLGRPLLFATR